VARALWLEGSAALVSAALFAAMGVGAGLASLGCSHTAARSAALAATVPPFFALSSLALATTLSKHAVRATLTTMSGAPAGVAADAALNAVASEITLTRIGAVVAFVLLLLGLTLSIHGTARFRPGAGSIVGGVALGLVTLAGFGLVWLPRPVFPELERQLTTLSSPASLPLVSAQLAPLTMDGPDLVLSADELRGQGVEPADTSDEQGMQARLAEFVAVRPAIATRRGRVDVRCGGVPARVVRIALAAEVDAATLQAFARAATDAGMDAIIFLGTPADAERTRAAISDLRRHYPLLATLIAIGHTEVAVALPTDWVEHCFKIQSRRLDSDRDGISLGHIGPTVGHAPFEDRTELAWLHLTNTMDANAAFASAVRWSRRPLRVVLSVEPAPQPEGAPPLSP